MAWTIRYFVDEDGKIPGVAFEDSLPQKLRGKLATFIAETARAEGALGGGIVKTLHTYSNLFEIRAKVGRDLARSIFTRDGTEMIILNGVLKAIDEETPAADVDRADHLRNRYLQTKRTEPPF